MREQVVVCDNCKAEAKMVSGNLPATWRTLTINHSVVKARLSESVLAERFDYCTRSCLNEHAEKSAVFLDTVSSSGDMKTSLRRTND